MDYLKAILPVLTFIAGYFLSNLDRHRDLRRKLRNLKMILFMEMSANYEFLNSVLPLNVEEKPIAELVESVAWRLSSDVYDRYLDRLDQLQIQDLSKIYQGCAMLKRLQADVKKFRALKDRINAGPEITIELNMQAMVLSDDVQICHEPLAKALGVFQNGPSFLQGQKAKQGKLYELYKESCEKSRD